MSSAALKIARRLKRRKGYADGGAPEAFPEDIRRVHIRSGAPVGEDESALAGNVDYDPMTGVPIGGQMSPEPAPDPQGAVSRMLSRLTGTQFGEPRHQLWPEKMVRSGVSLAGDVLSGDQAVLPPGLRREDYTDTPVPTEPTADSTWLGRQMGWAPQAAQPNDPMMERAQDMAGLAGGQTLLTGAVERSSPASAGRLLAADSQATGAPLAALERVHHNPGKRELDAIMGASQHQSLRGLIDDSGAYVWDAGTKTHHDQAKAVGLDYNIENRFHLTPEEGGYYKLDIGPEWAYNPEKLLANKHLVRLLSNDKVLIENGGYGTVTGPEFLKTLASDSAQTGAPLSALQQQAAHAPKFYSGLERAVEAIPQPTMTGQQWLGTLTNRGVKPEEIQWTGLGDYLAAKVDQPVTKVEVAQHLGANQLKLGEKELGLPPAWEDLSGQRQYELIDAWDMNPAEAREHYEARRFSSDPDELVDGGVRYSEYQLPGGENYREKLLTLPAKEPPGYQFITNPNDGPNGRTFVRDAEGREMGMWPTRESAVKAFKRNNPDAYQSSHWKDVPNVLAHRRTNERDVVGVNGQNDIRRSAHIEEIQSDLHQQGRKHGYKLNERERARWEKIKAKPEKELTAQDLKDIEAFGGDRTLNSEAVPDAPFKKNWHELVLKDAIREAAEKGLDRISWTPGEAQAARYDLSKHVGEIWAKPVGGGKFEMTVMDKDGGPIYDTGRTGPVTADKISETIGKEFAEKISKQDGEHTYAGVDLKVGGEGMKGFYDKMIPDALNKIGKKHGVKVEKGNTNSALNDAGRAIKEFESQFGSRPIPAERKAEWNALRDAVADAKKGGEPHPVHYMDIPQSLKDEVLQKGFSLFEDSATAGAPLAALESGAKGERIRSAAIRHGGQVYEAPIHGAAYDDAAKATGKSLDKVISKTRPEDSGFVTSTGRFVTREEAARIAQEAEQVGPLKSELAAENFRDGDLAAPATQTPQFKKWFGGSKAVDENGQPQRFYHGTTSEFDTFGRIDGGNQYGAGYYFTKSPESASNYATGDVNRITPKGNADPNVMPVYLKYEKPYDRRGPVAQADLRKLEAAANEVEPGHWKKGELTRQFDRAYPPNGDNVAYQLGPQADKIIRKAGFDAFVAPDMTVVFEPTQIKSATGNSGAFDPKNPSIMLEDASAMGAPLAALQRRRDAEAAKLGYGKVEMVPVDSLRPRPENTAMIEKIKKQDEAGQASFEAAYPGEKYEPKPGDMRHKVGEIRQALERGEEVPPLAVRRDGTIEDGENRWNAYKAAGIDMIPIRRELAAEAETGTTPREGFKALDSSPQERALTVNDVLDPATPAQKPRSRGVEEIAKDLMERGAAALRKLGVETGRIEGSNPRTDELVARSIASEAKAALQRGGKTASDWYTQKIAEAMDNAAAIHPELKNDPHQKMGFTTALAVTSQGETVTSNVRLADQVYDHFKKTGRFPTNVQAKTGPAMNSNFAKMNALLDELGPDGVRDFLHKEFTVKELEQAGYDVGGENKQTKVYGSAILGPKIGQGFYQNLNGNYKPVTMDLWFMRGWGRLTGTLVGKTDMAKPTQRLVDAIKADGGKVPRDPSKLELIAEDLVKAHERDFKTNRALYNSGERKRSELSYAAERYLKNLKGINEQPTSGAQRVWMRSVVDRAREILEGEGHKVTNADLQAIWWYPEKELYSKLGGRDSEAINVDYASAFKDLADKMKGQNDAEKGPVRTAPRGRSADQADDTGGGKVSGGRGEEADGAQVNPALEIARKVKRAKGGRVHVGPITGATGGRADKRPMEVPDGAYVLTADHVSGLGEGNTDAGMKKLSAMFPASKPSALRQRAAGGATNVPIYAADGEFVIHPDDIVDRFGELEYGHRALDAWQTAERQELIKTLEQLDPPAQD